MWILAASCASQPPAPARRHSSDRIRSGLGGATRAVAGRPGYSQSPHGNGTVAAPAASSGDTDQGAPAMTPSAARQSVTTALLLCTAVLAAACGSASLTAGGQSSSPPSSSPAAQ